MIAIVMVACCAYCNVVARPRLWSTLSQTLHGRESNSESAPRHFSRKVRNQAIRVVGALNGSQTIKLQLSK